MARPKSGKRTSGFEGAVARPPERCMRRAKFRVGEVVRHRLFGFRGIVYDIDAAFNSTEEWWQSIPEHARPHKDQPFYHLLAENSETEYIAYASEQNLISDTSKKPLRHPQVAEMFVREAGAYRATFLSRH